MVLEYLQMAIMVWLTRKIQVVKDGCENTGSFVKMQLFFSKKWLLITEITFNSGICCFVVIMHNNLCATKI